MNEKNEILSYCYYDIDSLQSVCDYFLAPAKKGSFSLASPKILSFAPTTTSLTSLFCLLFYLLSSSLLDLPHNPPVDCVFSPCRHVPS